ncbi:MAG: YtxH domain-containing protein [Candidatus Microsaccharimonas sp.]
MNKALSIVVVAASSFIAGILLAPKSGKETREDLKAKANDYKIKADAGLKEVRKGAKAVKGEVTEGVDAIKDIAKDASGDFKRTAGRVKEEASTRAKVIQGQVQQASEDTKQATRSR